MRGQTIKSTNGSADTDKIDLEVERLAELGRLSSSMLHEISNPLTSALLYIEQYKDQPAAAMRKVHGSMKVLWRYVEALRQQIRSGSESSQFSVNQQVAQLKRVVIPLAKRADVKLRFELCDPCKLYGDPVKFQQILGNLIVNAIEAYGSEIQHNLTKQVNVKIVSNHDAVIISVSDWGQGIKPSQLSKIFEPFYTTKNKNGQGLGIGLAIVNQYVTGDFSGTIDVKSSGRIGTCFSIRIPVD